MNRFLSPETFNSIKILSSIEIENSPPLLFIESTQKIDTEQVWIATASFATTKAFLVVWVVEKQLWTNDPWWLVTCSSFAIVTLTTLQYRNEQNGSTILFSNLTIKNSSSTHIFSFQFMIQNCSIKMGDSIFWPCLVFKSYKSHFELKCAATPKLHFLRELWFFSRRIFDIKKKFSFWEHETVISISMSMVSSNAATTLWICVSDRFF